MHRRVFLAAALVFFLSINLQLAAQQPVLHVYGPGGPLGPLQECADLFSAANQVKVVVTASPDPRWFSQAQQDADLIFGGAGYMLTEFASRRPEILDEKSRVELYARPAGILVRKGNPKKINSAADLAQPGLRALGGERSWPGWVIERGCRQSWVDARNSKEHCNVGNQQRSGA